MGAVLPKPVLSKVVDREGNSFVNGASSCINGYRSTMEDAHMMYAGNETEFAFFGIFDGHSNSKCSNYLAEHVPAKLKALATPITATMLENVCIEVDQAFLEQKIDGGSTGTFCVIHRDGKMFVVNVGDSRTLVSRGGSLVFCTEDHKPYDEAEHDRIVRCGGTVVGNRIDGDLAVSRAFGDISFKARGTTDVHNQKVIPVPDVSVVECQPGDTIILACDGVFESNFSNEEVCRFVQDQLPKCWDDLGVIASRVCDEAIRRGSKDNISCMVLQLVDGTRSVEQFGRSSFVPGAPFPRNHEACRTSYAKMAEIAHLTIAEALAQRYKLFKARGTHRLNDQPPVMRTAFEMSDEVDMEAERAFFGRGPAPGNETAFFEALATTTGN